MSYAASTYPLALIVGTAPSDDGQAAAYPISLIVGTAPSDDGQSGAAAILMFVGTAPSDDGQSAAAAIAISTFSPTLSDAGEYDAAVVPLYPGVVAASDGGETAAVATLVLPRVSAFDGGDSAADQTVILPRTAGGDDGETALTALDGVVVGTPPQPVANVDGGEYATDVTPILVRTAGALSGESAADAAQVIQRTAAGDDGETAADLVESLNVPADSEGTGGPIVPDASVDDVRNISTQTIAVTYRVRGTPTRVTIALEPGTEVSLPSGTSSAWLSDATWALVDQGFLKVVRTYSKAGQTAYQRTLTGPPRILVGVTREETVNGHYLATVGNANGQQAIVTTDEVVTGAIQVASLRRMSCSFAGTGKPVSFLVAVGGTWFRSAPQSTRPGGAAAWETLSVMVAGANWYPVTFTPGSSSANCVYSEVGGSPVSLPAGVITGVGLVGNPMFFSSNVYFPQRLWWDRFAMDAFTLWDHNERPLYEEDFTVRYVLPARSVQPAGATGDAPLAFTGWRGDSHGRSYHTGCAEAAYAVAADNQLGVGVRNNPRQGARDWALVTLTRTEDAVPADRWTITVDRPDLVRVESDPGSSVAALDVGVGEAVAWFGLQALPGYGVATVTVESDGVAGYRGVRLTVRVADGQIASWSSEPRPYDASVVG